LIESLYLGSVDPVFDSDSFHVTSLGFAMAFTGLVELRERE
jgi:hypothetical protein